MSAPIDESAAWHLVRAVRPALDGDIPVSRVQYDPRPDVWVQVRPSGEWEASTSTTKGARVVLDLFLPLQTRSDLVIGQAGQSLDGRIATESGRSHYITGREDIIRLHRLRALVDAVVVGVGTVESDDPRLTVREVDGDNPVRVVLDPRGRADPGRAVFTDGAARTLVVRRDDPDTGTSAPTDLSGSAAEVVPLAAGAAGFDPRWLLSVLREMGLRRILVEGGGVTVSRFLQAGALDRLHVTVAPMLIGSGRPAFTLEPVDTLDEALRPRCRHFRLGNDVLFDLDLRATK